MSEQEEKILAYDNQFHEFLTQVVTGADCVVTPFPVIMETDNLVTLRLTQEELRELLSSIQIGAEWAYPDKSQQILFNFMKGLICPPELQPDAACTKYSPTSTFVHYQPNHPDDTEAPAGYLWPAWVRFGNFDSIFPDWLDDWAQGIIEATTGYQATDVLCNIASFPANTIEAFLSGGGILPSFQIHCTGTGTIELEILSFPLGGRCVVELDEAPNIFDLLTGGILDPGAIVIDTNRDIFSYPPEENVASTIKFEVDTPGDHILYVVFVPTINDSLDFIGLGGGIRSIELCGFEEIVEMGIEAIIWDGCELKVTSGGIETVVVTAAEIQACMDFTGIGGSGGGNFDSMYKGSFLLPGAITTASTTFIDADATNLKQTIVLENASHVVAAFYIPQLTKGTGGSAQIQLSVSGSGGGMILDSVFNAVTEFGRWLIGEWDLAAGTHDIKLQLQATGAGNAVLQTQQEISWQVYVFTDAENAFVQDVRIEAGELQKKIGGVWYDVANSFEAIINNLQSDIAAANVIANNALSIANDASDAASSALVKANQALDENDVQDGLIAGHETRIDNLESCCDTATAAIADHEARLSSVESELDALQGSFEELDMWTVSWGFGSSPNGWTYSGVHTVGEGFIVDSVVAETLSFPSVIIEGNQIESIIIRTHEITGGEQSIVIDINGQDATLLVGSDGESKTSNNRLSIVDSYSLELSVYTIGIDTSYSITAIQVFGRGENPFV